MRSWIFGLGVAAVLATGQAAAYNANVGDRAQDFAGYDIVSKSTVRLEDYLGQWVLVEFWATWCGPCMRQLPLLLEQTAAYRKGGQLSMLSISCDAADGLPDLKRTISKHGIDYPVLFDGSRFKTVPAQEWQVTGIPATYLVDPQGVIVATGLHAKDLSAALNFYLSAPRPILGLRTSSKLNADGTVGISAEVTNPAHTPVRLQLTRRWERWPFRPDGILDREQKIQRTSDPSIEEVMLTFDDFGEGTHQFLLTPPEGAHIIGYSISAEVPASSGLVGEDGISFRSGERQAYVRGMVYRDGDFRLLEGEEGQRWRPMAELER
jgi:peroxiredoxin